MKIIWTRSESWLRTEAVRRAENVPARMAQACDATFLTALSAETRARLVRADGSYPAMVGQCFLDCHSDTPDYQETCYSHRLDVPLRHDSDSITPAEAEAMLRAAWDACETLVRTTNEAAAAKRAALVAQPDREWAHDSTRRECLARGWVAYLTLGTFAGSGYSAADEKDPRIVEKTMRVNEIIRSHNNALAAEKAAETAAYQSAEKLMAPRLDHLNTQIMKVRAERDTESARANFLASIVAALPADALAGVVKQMAAEKTAAEVAELRARIERAAGIADDDESDDESDDE